MGDRVAELLKDGADCMSEGISTIRKLARNDHSYDALACEVIEKMQAVRAMLNAELEARTDTSGAT